MHTLEFEIDCTTCGCPDVEVVTEPSNEGWFADGVARCNNCRQIFTFRAPKEGPPPTTVVEHLVECPACHSIDCPVQRSVLPIRYRRCGACGHTFKSVVKRKTPA